MFCELYFDNIRIPLTEEQVEELVTLYESVDEETREFLTVNLLSDNYQVVTNLAQELMEATPSDKDKARLEKKFRSFVKQLAAINFKFDPEKFVVFRFADSTEHETSANVKIRAPK